MANSKQNELDRVLNCSIKNLADLILPMSDSECERHARGILHRIGGPSFDELLMRIVEIMVPPDGGRPPSNSEEYYFGIRDLFPHVPKESDVLGRLLSFVMRMSVLRLEKRPSNFWAAE